MADVDHGTPIYKAAAIKKINSLRRARSQFDSKELPILDESQVMFVTAASRNNEPNSCYNCRLFNLGKSCMRFGPSIHIRKFTYPKEATDDSKPIEYWPVCGSHTYGEPNKGPEQFNEYLADPDLEGLVWVNAPEVGQEYGGTNCGGVNGADDCDNYIVDEPGVKKRETKQGFCRVLQKTICAGDCCSAWTDDDLVKWNEAQSLL